MKDYHGNRTPYLYALYHEADRAKVLSVLEAMAGRGFAFCGVQKQHIAYVKKALAVLAFLSADFYADEAKQNEFFTAKDSGVPLIPILLDDTPMPEIMMQAMYAKNSLIASRYPTDKALAERILTAEAFQNPTVTAAQKKASRMGLIGFCAAAAVVLAACTLLLIPQKEPEQQVIEVIEEKTILPFGLSEQDLQEIKAVKLIGETHEFQKKTYSNPIGGCSRTYVYANEATEQHDYTEPDVRYTYVNQLDPYDHVEWEFDGKTVSMAEYNLDFLALLPNLQDIALVNVRADKLPDLSGLKHLDRLHVFECDIPDIQGIANSAITTAEIKGSNIQDYSPLGTCNRMVYLGIELGKNPSDISGLVSPRLVKLCITDPFDTVSSFDLSYLADSSLMNNLEISFRNIKNLEGISNLTKLKTLHLWVYPSLSLTGISNLKNLRHLYTYNNNTQLSRTEQELQELACCTSLSALMMNERLPSLRFLNSLTNLEYIDVHANEADLAFLNRMAKPIQDLIQISSPYITCSEPIEQITMIRNLSLDFQWNSSYENALGHAFDRVKISNLNLHSSQEFNLSYLPQVSGKLSFHNCVISDLTKLPNNPQSLSFERTTLSSLKGIPAKLSELEFIGNTGLRDWTPLEKIQISQLTFSGFNKLPSFSNICPTTILTLENIASLTNLDCLKPLLEKHPMLTLRFPGDRNLTDLSALETYTGNSLDVPPHLDREARQLVAADCFYTSHIVYPDHYISEYSMLLQPESLEDLKIMKPEELAQVEKIAIAGNSLFDTDECNAYLSSNNTVYIYSSSGNPVNAGSGFITDFSLLEKLPNLRSLTLVGQPLTSLNGIQKLDKLEELNITDCPNLTDISAAFTLPNLISIDMNNSPVSSLQGIQNLTRLDSLDIRCTNITDLSVLLSLNELRYVILSSNMPAAAKLQEMNPSFDVYAW